MGGVNGEFRGENVKDIIYTFSLTFRVGVVQAVFILREVIIYE